MPSSNPATGRTVHPAAASAAGTLAEPATIGAARATQDAAEGPPAPPPKRRPWTWPQGLPGPRPRVHALLAGLALTAWVTILAPPGLHWLAMSALVVALVQAGTPNRSLGRADVAVLTVAAALVAVGSVRTNGLIALCLVAGIGCAAIGLLDARRWPAIALAAPMLARTGVLGVVWVLRSAARPGLGRTALPWLRGGLVGACLLIAVTALLRSADPVFARLIDPLVPGSFGLEPGRAVLTGGVLAVAVALLGARVMPTSWAWLPGRRTPRPAAEWALPLVLVDAVLIAFVAVQALVALGGLSQALAFAGTTPAAHARQGFWQLVVVTVLIALSLGRAGRGADASDPRHCVVLTLLGGVAVAGALVLAGVALHRMWLYEQAFGWTVLRLLVGVFELWLGAMLLLGAWAWLMGRTELLPQWVVLSAGSVLLVTTLVSPDALVARWNVDRYLATGRFDVHYAASLSDDAAPHLARLPRPLRCEVLARDPREDDPAFAFNPSRASAKALRAECPPPAPRS